MSRWIGFFIATLVAMYVLRQVPGLGAIFQIPFFGFWLAALVVSGCVAWWGNYAVSSRRMRAAVTRLGAVDTPHNQGKLGSLLLGHGRPRRALEPLKRAVAGEPLSAEWRYRLGSALLATGDATGARAELERAAAIDPEHAYGAALMKLAQALLAAKEPAEALTWLERLESNHGESPESAYRKGQALKALGRKPEARASFARVGQLVHGAARFQKSEGRAFALRALLARVL